MMGGKRTFQPTMLAGILAAMTLGVASSWGQGTITANVTGGNGSGKCTFEVRVDGVADVQIRGNQGYLQTKAGMRAQWVRLKCNQPLPRNPNNFRFQGIDGRGKQYLLRNPAQNNGVAVIRIEDPKNGFEGYTGDILWSGGNSGGGNWNQWWSDDWNGGGGWGGGGGNGQWSNNVVPNCQRSVRSKVSSAAGGASVNFNGSPSTSKGGSFVMVDGNGNARANNGKQGSFNYHCTMHTNGNVADSSYNFTGGNFGPQPR